MARIRTIKPEFFTSLTIADLSLEARLTFAGLWTHADDEGRCVADARLIKAAIWPLDDRTSADVERDLKELTESSLITHYVVNGRSYFAVTNWREHQRINRPTASKFPTPPPDRGMARTADAPESSGFPPADTSTHGVVSEDSVSPHGVVSEDSPPERNREQGKEQGSGKETATPSPARETLAPNPEDRTTSSRGTRIPAGFHATDDMIAWARKETPNVGHSETQAFVDYWTAESGAKATKRDWVRAWQVWMRKEQKRLDEQRAREDRYAQSRQPPPSTAPTSIPDDQRCRKHRAQRAANCGLCRAESLARTGGDTP